MAPRGRVQKVRVKLPEKNVVLVGLGHTHAHVLQMWAMHGPSDARLTCISDRPTATYSGMLPGVLAGLLAPERMTIDLVRLSAACGAQLIVDQIESLDLDARQVRFAERPPLAFDALSIGVGSVPRLAAGGDQSNAVVAIKPMQTFLARLDARLRQLASRADLSAPTPDPVRIAIVGGGPGGIEIAFCLPARIKAQLGNVATQYLIIDAGTSLVAGASTRLRNAVQTELNERGIDVLLGRRVQRILGDAIELDDKTTLEADIIVWCGSASPPPLLARLGLPMDDQGFLSVASTLQTTAGYPIFAVGDSATIVGNPVPRAGVFAVRQGPVLLDNLKRVLSEKPLSPYRPQRDFLRLLNLGDGRALADWKGFAASGTWAWQLKSRIDTRFMDRFQNYSPAAMITSASSPASTSSAEQPMRCTGCGGKIGGRVLRNALARVARLGSPALDPGLAMAEDVVEVRMNQAESFAATTDFFAVPLDDAWLSGRIAALNAMSDAWAAGAKPTTALAIAAVREGSPRAQEQELFELLAGAVFEFERAGAQLVGGHSIENANTMLGFTVLAEPGPAGLRSKAKLAPGDQLILTKPLGTGVLLAAHMQCRCRAEWFQGLQAAMLRSNEAASNVATESRLLASTDVTGFGLAGHLIEMLEASNASADLYLSKIPLLAGAESLLREGIESTLAPANRDVESDIDCAASVRTNPAYAALFDPQTCGGLLLAAPALHAAQVIKSLHAAGVYGATIVGWVRDTPLDPKRLRVLG
ncbi:MAG: selenide,water dikinase [Hyphomicrobiaceae bacterium]|jgi:selenide,water dikinase